jgi:hypothetical protein
MSVIKENSAFENALVIPPGLASRILKKTIFAKGQWVGLLRHMEIHLKKGDVYTVEQITFSASEAGIKNKHTKILRPATDIRSAISYVLARQANLQINYGWIDSKPFREKETLLGWYARKLIKVIEMGPQRPLLRPENPDVSVNNEVLAVPKKIAGELLSLTGPH